MKVEDKNLVHVVILKDGSFDADSGEQFRKSQLHTSEPQMFANWFDLHRQIGWTIQDVLHIPNGWGWDEATDKKTKKETTVFKRGGKRKTIKKVARSTKKAEA